MAAAEKLVTQHLDLWATAIKRRSTAGRGSSSKVELYGIKKLRELILELAVRGMLVPQDPNDAPASELLKLIVAEKARQVKDGKIKKEKPLAHVGDDEKYFAAPAAWEWCRLQEVCEYIQRGKGPAYADFGAVRVVSQKCVQWPDFDISACRFVDDASIPGYKYERFLKSNDLLWNSTGTGTVGRANVLSDISEKTLVADSHVTVIRPLLVGPRYLCLFIWSPGVQTRIEPDHEKSLVSGSTQQVELNTSAVMALPVPIPPLNEQIRIVAKVDELMALCDQLERQTNASLGAHQTLVVTLLNALTSAADHAQFASSWQRIAEHFDTLFTTEESIDQLKEAILHLMANGALVSFPSGSQNVPLKKVLSFGPRNGFSPKECADERVTKVLKLGATSYGKLDLSQVKSFDQDIPPDSHLWLQKGDILVQRGNSHVFVGSNVLVEADVEKTIYPDLMMKLRVTGDALPGYVSLLLAAPQSRNHMWERMTGTSGTMPKISKGVVESIPVIVPPIEVQEKVISTIGLLFTVCDQIKSCLSDVRTTQQHLADALAEQALAEG